MLEPQVLRIADDDDLLENDLEVDESDEESTHERQVNYSRPGESSSPMHASIDPSCRLIHRNIRAFQ
jgi:hypothetical protein